MKSAKLNKTQREIVAEIYKAVEHLGAGIELLAAIGCWGDTLEDDEVLGMLERHNSQSNQRN